MPSEVRLIKFTPEDVLEAIDGFGAIADKRLFRGNVVDCHVRKHPGVHALLEVQRAAGDENKYGRPEFHPACCGAYILLL